MPPSKPKRGSGQRPAQQAAPNSSAQSTPPVPTPEPSAPQTTAQSRSVGSRPASQRRRTPARKKPFPWLWVIVGVVVIGIAALFFIRQPSAIAGVQTFPAPSRDHVDGAVNYPEVPPIGGAHNASWLKCDVYAEPVQNERAVHSMEHGAVWITYQPDLPADQVTSLQNLVRGQSYLLLSPYPGLPSPVVASAWGVQLKLDGASDERLQEFIRNYRQGPQTPEPGATC